MDVCLKVEEIAADDHSTLHVVLLFQIVDLLWLSGAGGHNQGYIKFNINFCLLILLKISEAP